MAYCSAWPGSGELGLVEKICVPTPDLVGHYLVRERVGVHHRLTGLAGRRRRHGGKLEPEPGRPRVREIVVAGSVPQHGMMAPPVAGEALVNLFGRRLAVREPGRRLAPPKVLSPRNGTCHGRR